MLQSIIDQFIATASPVGSKRLLEAGYFQCSSATLRSEMGQLEDEGYLEQPHVSAGRVPTAKGYRSYVQKCMQPSKAEAEIRKKFITLREQYFQRKDQERVYEAVALLAHMIPDVAFATVPHKDRVYYLGLANILKQPEFLANPQMATGVAEILEDHLTEVIDQLKIDEKIRYYIGEDNILPQVHSCSMMVTEYRVRDKKGVIGILGPMRMDYAYNTVTLDLVADLLRNE